MVLYIVLGIAALLMGVLSVIGFYFYFDGFEMRKRLANKPRAPFVLLAIYLVIYYPFLCALFIWR